VVVSAKAKSEIRDPKAKNASELGWMESECARTRLDRIFAAAAPDTEERAGVGAASWAEGEAERGEGISGGMGRQTRRRG